MGEKARRTGPTSIATVSLPSNLTMGWPPDSISTRFWGLNRATTLILFAFDMLAISLLEQDSERQYQQLCGKPQVEARWWEAEEAR